MNRSKTQNWLQLLGPGLLFAGAAVGVSHLVLSTRAGAEYGFGLIWLVLLANLIKYPFFEFGPRYAMATGKSLLEGYKQKGIWVLGIFILVTLGTMFTVQAAVTIVTASLATQLFGFGSLQFWVVLILLVCASLLLIGKYQLLDRLMKIIIISLTLITLVAVLIAIAYYDPKPTGLHWTPFFDLKDAAAVAFFASMLGWMPAPMDLSVWHSLWALEKKKASGDDYNPKRSIFDFNVGYLGTTFLAFFFLALGALVMYGSGESFSPKGAVFAKQLIELYTSTLGSGAAFFISIAAFITMFSTTITCLDALPRAMSKAHILSVHTEAANEKTKRNYYWIWMILLILGTISILLFFTKNMKELLLVATVLSFITAPFFAIVNTILISGKEIPENQRPASWIKLLSYAGIVFLCCFCGFYLWSLV
jgi:Mn2+/Fe2+ NRAMP family transporter